MTESFWERNTEILNRSTSFFQAWTSRDDLNFTLSVYYCIFGVLPHFLAGEHEYQTL